MLVSEKSALYQLLQTVGTTANTHGFMAFFRNGSSSNVPKSFLDLVATSRCAVEYKFQQQTTDANNTFCRVFSRGRSMMPIGGYGQGRTYFDPVTKTNIQTFAVYPEYSRFTLTANINKSPQQIMAMVGACSDIANDIGSGWSVDDMVEYDYGRTLRFRSFFVPSVSGINAGNVRLEYQDPTTLVWTRITVVAGMNAGLDIVARKLRLRMNGTASTSDMYFTPYAEKGSDFVSASLTHVVLVPLTQPNPSTTQSYLSQTQEDYYGLVLDVGADLTIGTTNIGQYGQMAVPDLTIRIADNFLEGV
ncbi:hypothetical protein pEaSNUABM35_00074 [Erwinia phage pEa_SNUABM_35]|uniref:Uncharacterized protein n=1 Tax=Erwinia phage pEa_SNUABM_35 TaxID=2869557 RepID=A0AAE7XP22_9CAUD|nr:hypothetical protein MPK65_gp074 [Erwinia phage pEa_SNUABM_35]QZE59991.1 hypothetical protein pEaSNUABM35_00074 [Erwinia phage pEa_SNUABM_35]QZE60327.1 hypothetical protein pEaSNUABM36_00074 [Erwinia phage pEa_SNUABM_36]